MHTARDRVWRHQVNTWYVLYTVVFVVWASLVVGTHPVQAAMLKLSVADLVRKADTIVLGTVTQQESAWDAEHTAIYTDVTVAVERVLAGAPGGAVTLRVAGGRVGGMGMRTSNDAVFREAERVIVFLDTTARPSSMVGMQQGKFTVQDNVVSSAGETWSLEEFMAVIRAAAR